MSLLLAAEKQLHGGRRWTKTSALGSKTREPCLLMAANVSVFLSKKSRFVFAYLLLVFWVEHL